MRALSNMPISFPGLFGDWEITASPVAIDIGKGIYWYGIFIALGLLLAIWFCIKQAPRFGLTEDNVLDTALVVAPAGVIGARIYYIIFYYDRFKNAAGGPDFGKMIAIWDGGLAIYGGVIAGVIGIYVLCRVKKIKIGALLDLAVLGLFVGQIFGRWGNFMNREAFGAETTLPWRMRLWVSATEYVEVHPTFLYESLWNLMGLLLMVFIVVGCRRFDGENASFYFLWYGIGRFWIEGLREDSLYLFGWQLFGQPIRVSQALSVLLAVGATAVLIYHLKVKPHTPEELFVNQVSKKAESAE